MVSGFILHSAEATSSNQFYVFVVEISSAGQKVMRYMPLEYSDLRWHLAFPQLLPVWVI
jgi:hypothetical protein